MPLRWCHIFDATVTMHSVVDGCKADHQTELKASLETDLMDNSDCISLCETTIWQTSNLCSTVAGKKVRETLSFAILFAKVNDRIGAPLSECKNRG
jgi:hypothetical protein